MYGVVLRLPLVGECKLFLKNRSLKEYVKRQFLNYYIKECDNIITRKDVVSYLQFDSNIVIEYFQLFLQEEVVFSSDKYWHDNKIILRNLEYDLEYNRLNIYVKEHCSFKKYIKGVYRKISSISEEKRYAYFGGMFYRYALFPIFSVYAACFGMYCIHGSLIHLKDGRNIVISGLDGVGKSTLADIICSEEGSMLLADNIVLFNGIEAINFNLAMRLELNVQTNQKIIYQNRNLKEVLPSTNNIGICRVDKIINLLRGKGDEIKEYRNSIPIQDWIIYVEGAPEVGQANGVVSLWIFLYSLVQGKNNNLIDINTISIPNGKLDAAKEVILR